MVPSRERTEYMYELRNIAENIVRERLEHLDLHPPVHTRPETFQCGEMQEVEHANSGNVGSAEAPLDEQTRSHSLGPAMDSPSAPVGSQAMPAFPKAMTQDRSLDDLPSQMDFDWQVSQSLNPTPGVGPAGDVPSNVKEVNEFVLVSQIAEEVVKDATEHTLDEET